MLFSPGFEEGGGGALTVHPYWVLVIISSAYSLVNVWAYLVVSIELYRRLPVEARRDARGGGLDFFSVR